MMAKLQPRRQKIWKTNNQYEPATVRFKIFKKKEKKVECQGSSNKNVTLTNHYCKELKKNLEKSNHKTFGPFQTKNFKAKDLEFE